MKRIVYLILGFSVFIFLIVLVGFYLNTRTLQSQSFYASVNVTDENIAGFDANWTALTFGSMGKGGTSTRKIKLENGYPFPVVVIINAEGDIATLLNYDEIIKIEKGERKIIALNAYAPLNLSRGFYSGRVEFLFKPA